MLNLSFKYLLFFVLFMILTLLGVVILLVPFLLICKFKDKRAGFVVVLIFFLIFHLVVGVLTQFLGFFNYLVVVVINLALDVFVLYKVDFRVFKKFDWRKVDFVLLAVVVIAFLCLYSVHNNYTGLVTSVFVPFSEVENMDYPYPYFSDEWVAVSLIQYSVSSGKLPVVNPLWYDSPFINLELPFHSFVSEVVLVLDLDPLTQYSLLHVFSGLLVCVLVFFVLRANGISKLGSSMSGLGVLYVVNGANLPGLWTLIPVVLGVLCLLCSLFFMSVRDKKMVFVSSLLILVFYPPLFVLSFVSVLTYFFFEEKGVERKKSFLFYLGFCFVVAVLLFLISLRAVPFWESLSYVKTKLFYPTFTANAIPDFSIWKVVPVFVLFFSVLGLLYKKKKFFILSPVFVGLAYWVLYSRVLWRFIIENERVVFATSVLVVLFSGFGVQFVLDYVKKNHDTKKYPVFVVLQACVLIFFLILSFSYTERSGWQDLKLHPLGGGSVSPAAPANNYLIGDDLVIFEGISEKVFLAVPWKGTVIGVATHNYPLDTKAATISNMVLRYDDFLRSSCEDKVELAKEFGVDYVYSSKFECRDFEELAISSENLYLYEFVG